MHKNFFRKPKTAIHLKSRMTSSVSNEGLIKQCEILKLKRQKEISLGPGQYFTQRKDDNLSILN